MVERDAESERDTGISEIWKAAAHPEPPAELDSRILAAARQAVTRPQPRKRGWWQLAVPFSATAVLVLAVALLLRVERQSPERLHDAAPSVMREIPVATEGDTQAWQALPSADVEAAKVRSEPKRAAAPSLEATPTADALATAGVSPEAGSMPRAGAADVGEADRLEVPVAQPAPLLRQQAAPAASMELGRAKAEGGSPSQAVEQIRRLLADGRREEALAALEELRRRHPDYQLPADLQTLR